MSNLLLAPWNCPECDGVNYGLPYCIHCDWFDKEFDDWSKGLLKETQEWYKSQFKENSEE